MVGIWSCLALAPEPPRAPPAPLSLEAAHAKAIREVELSMASFYLTGAIFCRSQEQAVECYGKYLELQFGVMVRDLKASLRP